LPDYETDHTPVDYSAIARAAGIHSIRVEKPADLRSALSDGLHHPGPALIKLVTDPNVLEMPPHLTTEQVRGFALASVKVVLGGGVGRMLDLARANLRYGTAPLR
jgi:pyruvate dehydrogenase (quinone)